MLKKLALTVAITALCVGPASAGDCLEGSRCVNCCPLAKAANERLATGHESLAVSKKARKDFVDVVLANLAAI
ncbi:MAG: hypothetical protein ACYTGZ_02760 [Planctomycetota bacterium]|jgi:hypothetical protein